MELHEVVTKLKGFAPLSLAESWDNVGLLVEPSPIHVVRTMLLTNDLTESVATEAVSLKADLILSYHPPIFQAMKRLTQQSWKDRIIVKCIENRIAVYSPHTSYDTVKGGVNDWLISPFGGKVETLKPSIAASCPTAGDCRVTVRVNDCDVSALEQQLGSITGLSTRDRLRPEGGFGVQLSMNVSEKLLSEVVSALQLFSEVYETMEIVKFSKPPLPGHGQGRLTRLYSPLTVRACVELIKSHLGLKHIRLALAVGQNLDGDVNSVAVCAGSGGSVLSGVRADLYVTGEMSHHEVLNATHSGVTVFLCEHSNTERGFLAGILRQKLSSLFDGAIDIRVSDSDRDPLEIV